MKKTISILACLSLIFAQVACAAGTNTLYHTDFSSMTGISGDAVLAADPMDDGNTALYFGGTSYTTTEIGEGIDLTTPVNIEGRLYREYEGKGNPYWDLRLFLLTDTEPVMLTAFGKNVYLGSSWQNISVYDYADGIWSDFRIRLTKDGGSVKAELYLDGNFYGSTTESVAGTIKGIKLASLTGEGEIYADDISYIAEAAELAALMSAIEADTADKSSCEKWIAALSGDMTQTAAYCYDTILSYAESKGYIETGAIATANPANGSNVYVGDKISYAFFGNLDEDTLPTVTINGNSVTASVEKNVLTIDAELEPGESYVLSVSGLKTDDKKNITFEDVSFATKNIPVVSVVEGGSYAYGTAVTWEEIPGVTTSVKVSDGKGGNLDLANGGKLTLSGNLTLTLKAGDDEHSISIYVVPNSAPVAKLVKLTEEENTLKGTYEYYDADGDNEDKAKTVIGWYTSSTKDGEYTLLKAGDSLDINEDVYDKYIKFGVTPISDAEPLSGKLTMSDAYIAPFRPVANNVRISGDAEVGETLTGYYDYFDANGDKENAETVMEWVDKSGNVVATGAAIALKSSHKGDELAFRVTVKNGVEPNTGETVTSSYVKVTSGSSGGSSGGGGKGSGIIVGSNSGSGSTGGMVTGPVQTLQKGEYVDTLNHWAEDAIKDLTLAGVVNGISATHFNPDGTITRAELAAMIMRAKNAPAATYGGMFADIPSGAWYADYVQMAVNEGVISPDVNFRPNDPVTRQEAAKLMSAFLSADAVSAELTFADSANVSDWAVSYVKKAFGAGYFKGDDKGNFNPLNSMTRAEAATILWRALGLNGGEV